MVLRDIGEIERGNGGGFDQSIVSDCMDIKLKMKIQKGEIIRVNVSPLPWVTVSTV